MQVGEVLTEEPERALQMTIIGNKFLFLVVVDCEVAGDEGSMQVCKGHVS